MQTFKNITAGLFHLQYLNAGAEGLRKILHCDISYIHIV
jgi:hypothetical protein